MNWDSRKRNHHIHVYYLYMWENKYKYNCTNTCDHPFSSNFSAIIPTCIYMSKHARKVISWLGDCFFIDLGVYIRIYGSSKPPHLLPSYSHDKIVIMEIGYHTYVTGFGASMLRKKKHHGQYFPYILKHTSWLVGNKKRCLYRCPKLSTLDKFLYKNHNPRGVIKIFCKSTNMSRPYAHFTILEETFYKKTI